MARTAKKSDTPTKLTPTQLRKKVEDLEEKYNKLADSAFCYMCGKHKSRDKFYLSTDPLIESGCTPICKECARKLAVPINENGEEVITKESVQKALRYLNKPFLNTVWDASMQESQNLLSGKVRSNVWTAYVKNIAMGQYVGMTYFDSDFYKNKVIYNSKHEPQKLLNDQFNNVDNTEELIKNKKDVIRLLGYDPFTNENIDDQPFLYSQLLGFLDVDGQTNEDMMRNSSIITIVRGFLQANKIDNSITKLMTNICEIEKNSATIKSLQDSKSKLTTVIKELAAESCISLKNNKNAKKGENTWTGKIKKIKDIDLRDGRVNGFDMATCKAMRQVMDHSNHSIMNELKLDDSEWSDMVAEQREMIVDLQNKLNNYIEISRILLSENLDLKDLLKDADISTDKMKLVNLDELFSPFAADDTKEEDNNEE